MVVAYFHGEATGQEMRGKFENVFKKGGVPEDAPEWNINGAIDLVGLLVDSKLLASKGEARRMIKQNAVSIVDGEKLTNESESIDESFKGKVVKVGKRKFLRLV